MERLMKIWPSKSRIDSVCVPKIMEVHYCKKLTNIFPANVISHLHDLEILEVTQCNSLEVVFNLQQGTNDVHNQLQDAQSGVFWGPTPNADQFFGLRTLRSIHVEYCRSLRYLFKPSIFHTHVQLQLEYLVIIGCKEFVAIDSNESQKSISRKIPSKQMINLQMEGPSTKDWAVDIDPPRDKTVAIFPSHVMQSVCRLKRLKVEDSESSAEVVFEMEQTERVVKANNDSGQTSTATQGFNDLEELYLYDLSRMTHVWKWKKSAVQGGRGLVFVDGFQNLTGLRLRNCGNIKYLFTPSMAKALVKLQTLNISNCLQMEVVVSESEEKETYAHSVIFPCLVGFDLYDLPNLKCIGGSSGITSNNDAGYPFPISNQKLGIGPAQDATAALCNSKVITVSSCRKLLHVIPSYAVARLQKLEELTILDCENVEEVFESEGLNIEGSGAITIQRLKTLNLKDLPSLKHIWRSRNGLVLQFPFLKKLETYICHDMTHIFTCSMVACFMTLETLKISRCRKMKEIIKEENEEVEAAAANGSMRKIRFSRLNSLMLDHLPNLVAVSSAVHHGFQWPQLDALEIIKCPEMRMFTYCHSAGPKVWQIKTKDGVEQDQDINSFVKRKAEEGYRF